MSQVVSSLTTLTAGQRQLIARHAGIASGKHFVDIGCGTGDWVRELNARGLHASGLEDDKSAAAADERIHHGSPAAAVPWEAHSLDRILFHGTAPFYIENEFAPETLIALANLGSCLKKRGRLLIPVTSDTSADALRWTRRLAIFPGTLQTRELKTGLRDWITLVPLFRGRHQICLIEFSVSRKLVSRLEWHQIARTAVMENMRSPAAA